MRTMKILTTALFVLCSLIKLQAQTTFDHTASAIDEKYFDPSLAPFYHGVASGDPLNDRVIIWTRITPSEDAVIDVNYYVATDTAFTQIVKQGNTKTDYTKDYTVKVDVTGLEPGVTYYYYFNALNANSIVGRTHTVATYTDHLKFAVVSCANYQMGYFNAYKRISEREDLDAVLHLGDYIYEYPTYGYGWTAEVNRKHFPDNELRTRDDYRIRHSFYKLDPDLRAAHQQHPFITVWDDHEIVNNSNTNGAGSANDHNDEEDGDYKTRKYNAVSAYMEWMPIRQPEPKPSSKIYRKFSFGGLAELYMVDTRLEDRSQQVTSSSDPELKDPERTILGEEQRDWLLNGIKNSDAVWKIIGNQVMFSTLNTSFKLDAWDGYPFEQTLVQNELINQADKNTIILTGDTHRSWSFDLTNDPHNASVYQPETGKGTFGIELGTPSIASPNENESNPTGNAGAKESITLQDNPHLRYHDITQHGYFVLNITPFKAQADYYYGPTKTRSNEESFAQGMFTLKDDVYLRKTINPSPAKTTASTLAPNGAFHGIKKVEETLGFNNLNQTLITTGVYPNPTSDKIYIGFTSNIAEELTIKFITTEGKIIQQKEFDCSAGNHTVEYSLQDFPKGAYIISIDNKKGALFSRNIIKN